MKKRKKQNITAIIYDKRGRILSVGKNSYVKTHPLQAQLARKVGRIHCIFLHAEIQAIIKCEAIEKAYRIVVTQYDNDNKPCLAKPCIICMEAISSVGIKVVEHT